MVKTIKMPWAAWRSPKYLELNFPNSWEVEACRMAGCDYAELMEEEIKESILEPIGTNNLREMAEGKENAVIVVDDMTRTTPGSKILPTVVDQLEQAGLSKDDITIMLALGAHKPMTREDCIIKLGEEMVNTINIENHHPYENLVDLGVSSIGTPIKLNATYYNADLKISIGGVVPHPLAGFGGGAKMVLPGVCGIETLEANHSAAMRGVGAGIGRMTGVREDIEEIVEKVGLDFSINVLFNEVGEVIAMNSGHFKEAHRNAMELASEIYATEVSLDNDVGFFNCFPEDSELNQAVKGFNLLMTAPNKMIKRKGGIVLMSSSYEGRGYHSLLAETGARLFTNYGDSIVWKAFVKKRSTYFFSPNISEHDLHHLFPKSMKLFREWDELIKELEKEYGSNLKATVVPTSMQLSK